MTSLELIHDKISTYYRLMRIDKPIGIFLLLWPTLWALWIATPGFPPVWILIVFIVGICLMRTAGCIVNDYVDRKFDGYVKRTTHRPLVNGEITKKETFTLFIVLVFLSFLIVLTLNTMTILLSVVAIVLSLIYPFMKRYTYLPQVILGAAFGWSIPMAFSAVSEALPLKCWVMFVANILWVIIYDTQYAMLDRDDDIKIGLKSTAILFGEKDKLILGILQIFMLILMAVVGVLSNVNKMFYFSILVSGLLFVYQQKLLRKHTYESYFHAFMNNNYIGFALFIGLIIR